MLSVFCYQDISPGCQHSDRIKAVGVVFPSHWRNQFITQILASPDRVREWFKMSSRKFYKTLLWIGFNELNSMYEVSSKTWRAGTALTLWVMAQAGIMLLIFPGGCQSGEEVASPSEVLNPTGQQLISWSWISQSLATKRRHGELWQCKWDFFWSEVKVGDDKHDKDFYCVACNGR